MARSVNQQSFDEVVQENINDFGLSPEDAVAEAVNQFTAQGMDLSGINTLNSVSESPLALITGAVEKLNKLNAEENDPTDYNDVLTVLKEQCEKDVQSKVTAAKAGAYDALLNTIDKHRGNKDIQVLALKAMLSLMTKQPDLLNEKGKEVILSNIGPQVDSEVLKLTLRWAKECCVMHEMNRQSLFNANIVEKLTLLVKEANPDVLKETLGVIRALLLDDDVRVEFGRAHEHARVIAAETLDPIMKLLHQFKSDEALIHDVLLTLSSLLVRAEFCKVVEEFGILELVHEAMMNYTNNEKIHRQCFKLLKALAGNDDTKNRIIEKGLAPVISGALDTHKHVVPTASAGLNCVAAISLRSPDNSKALYEASVTEAIIEIMKQHPTEKSIQKPASWAIRNMVSRSRYQNSRFLELGAEDLLKSSLKRFKEFEYDIKAALRDLECDVELREEWTGKGGKLTSDSTQSANFAK